MMSDEKFEKIVSKLREIVKPQLRDDTTAVITFRLVSGGYSGDADVLIKAKDNGNVKKP